MARESKVALPRDSYNLRQLRKLAGANVKFHPDLLRALLLHVESNADRPVSSLSEIGIEGWTDEQIAYHVILADEDGLLRATLSEYPDAHDEDLIYVDYRVHRLTSRGHDFLAYTADGRAWKFIKATAARAGKDSVDALFQIALTHGRKAIENAVNAVFS